MKLLISLVAIAFTALSASALIRSQEDPSEESSTYAKQLASADPVIRQAGAEQLARIVALDQRKLVEGYLLQEKDKRVRLALNWALYRMGKSQQLFTIVRDLDSSRHHQAVTYLSQLESADSLYTFLRQEDTHPKIVLGLIEALGNIGDGASLQEIKPYLDSYEPQIADAAKISTDLIQQRLNNTPSAIRTRPRTVEKPEQP